MKLAMYCAKSVNGKLSLVYSDVLMSLKAELSCFFSSLATFSRCLLMMSAETSLMNLESSCECLIIISQSRFV